MDLRWFQGMSPDAKENFKNLLLNSTQVLGKLKEILVSEGMVLTRQESTYSDFEDPNWPYKQAYRNGEKAAIKRLINLITIKE